MTEKIKYEQIEQGLTRCAQGASACISCPYFGKGCTKLPLDALDYINRLKSAKQQAETQFKELLSALYQKAGEKGFTLYCKDIVELVNDYGIKEEGLK